MWQRWNQTTHIFEKSDDDGVTWVSLPLSAVILTEGSLDSARLPNPITVDLALSKTRPVVSLLHSGTTKARIAQFLAGTSYVSENLSYDGANWNLDDTSVDGILLAVNPGASVSFGVFRATAGANPRIPSQLLAVDLSGNIACNQLQPAANIKFPAAQNPAADANTLDDYEEGTWTPGISSTGGGAPTYSIQSGSYTKIGDLVCFSGRITLSALGTLAAGNVRITGLPFIVGGSHHSVTFGFYGGMTSAILSVHGFCESGTTTMQVRGNTAAATSIGWLTVANLGGTTDLIFSGFYKV